MNTKLAMLTKNKNEDQRAFAVFVSFALFAIGRGHKCSVTVTIDG